MVVVIDEPSTGACYGGLISAPVLNQCGQYSAFDSIAPDNHPPVRPLWRHRLVAQALGKEERA